MKKASKKREKEVSKQRKDNKEDEIAVNITGN